MREKLAFADGLGSSVAENEYGVAEENDEPTSRSDPRWLPYMKRWIVIAAIWSAATFLGHWVLWPLPMYAAKFTFTENVSP